MIDLLEKKTEELLASVKDSKVKEAMQYAMQGNGKRLRPMLGLTVLKCYGIEPQDYVDVMLSVEMIHTYSLIHDDLPAMDDDAMRRGRPTVHKAFDEATAILTGDALLTDAFFVIMNSQILADNQKVKVAKILAECSGSNGMVYGQMMDLESELKQVNLKKLMAIHVHKTAKLIQAPLMIACVIANEEDVQTWEAIGYHLGLAFQIQDDVLEVTSNEETMGKSFSDVRNEKSTYVRLLGLREAQKEADAHFRRIDELLETLTIDKQPLKRLLQKIKSRKK